MSKPTNRCKQHRYRKVLRKTTGKMIWKCMDCPHYLYDNAQLVGNVARCFNSTCLGMLKITFTDMQKAKLVCGNCDPLLPGFDSIDDILAAAEAEEEAAVESGSLEDIVAKALKA